MCFSCYLNITIFPHGNKPLDIVYKTYQRILQKGGLKKEDQLSTSGLSEQYENDSWIFFLPQVLLGEEDTK